MTTGKDIRYKILRYLRDRQGVRTDLDDIVTDLKLGAADVSDQLDILNDLGAIEWE